MKVIDMGSSSILKKHRFKIVQEIRNTLCVSTETAIFLKSKQPSAKIISRRLKGSGSS